MSSTGKKPDVRTPVSVLTGFLGSGKTTLLNKALAEPGMQKTLVVINEYGEVGIDHLLVTSSSDNIVVLENGCLCCTVFGDLVGTLTRLYHAREAAEIGRFDHVVIETSGLADPRPVLQAFLSDPVLQGLYRLASVVTVVDAVNGLDTLERHEESVRQIALADVVLVSKIELIEVHEKAGNFDKLIGRIDSINPAAAIHHSNNPSLSWSEILRANCLTIDSGATSTQRWLRPEVYLPVTRAGGTPEVASHAHKAGVSAYCLLRNEPIAMYAVELLLSAVERNLGTSLLRLKGLINVLENPGRPAVVHGAQHLLHNLEWLDRWPDNDERTRLVFITEGMSTADLEEMMALLGRVAFRTAAARAAAIPRQ